MNTVQHWAYHLAAAVPLTFVTLRMRRKWSIYYTIWLLI